MNHIILVNDYSLSALPLQYNEEMLLYPGVVKLLLGCRSELQHAAE